MSTVTHPRPVRRRRVRSAQGKGRAVAPMLRPARALTGPSLATSRSRPRACGAEAAPTRWRLTDRGIAVILVAALMIATAALTVVTLTALQVTGDSYDSPGVPQVR